VIESTAARRRSWWPAVPGLSARFRILLWCSLLVAAALAASIVATRVILLQHLSAEVDTELHNELNEVSKVELSGIDRHCCIEHDLAWAASDSSSDR